MDMQDTPSSVQARQPRSIRWAGLGRYVGFSLFHGVLRPVCESWQVPGWTAKRRVALHSLG